MMRKVWLGIVASLGLGVLVPMALVGNAAAPAAGDVAGLPEKVDFARDIRPILSENCFACHGPDKETREAELRLDTREGALADLGGYAALAPGKPEKSELWKRITTDDRTEKMPPRKTGKKLSERQIALIKKWIEQDGQYSAHWSLVPPKSPAIPQVKNQGWVKNPIDAFVMQRLEKEGLAPRPEATKEQLIRRVTFDLTGLPPTPAEVEAFVKDTSPDAYEKVVERLLASPHYGERMALEWLDAARFADTHGFHIDSGRNMTLWREWVINAYNNNKPFNEFTVEQLAGDLLANPTVEQKIATGFNRNHMITFEGGAIPEEFLATYVMDRVNTTATVFLGLTVACAQCHDHKYDPITQKNYYELYAFFHNVPENPIDGRKGNAAPLLKVPTMEQKAALDGLAGQLASLEKKLLEDNAEVDAEQAKWEEAGKAVVAWTTVDPADIKATGGATWSKQSDRSLLASGPNPPTDVYTITLKPEMKEIRAVRVEALADPSLPAKGPGRSQNGNLVMTEAKLALGSVPVKLKAASADFSQDTFPAGNLIDGNPATGWAVYPQVGKAHQLVLELDKPVSVSDEPLVLTLEFNSIFAQHQIGRIRVSVTDAADPHATHKKVPSQIVEILGAPAEKRNDAMKAELKKYYREQVSPQFKTIRDELASLKKKKTEIEAKVPDTMVMSEMSKPRQTHLLMRGQYDKLGEKVTAAVPESMGKLPEGAPLNRLGLAQWLVSPDHPLTARVAVNRYWQMYFGTGLVKTSEDFGSQGEWPSHPELLDYLATEFVKLQWDVKAMQRMIVTSATYRQSSASPKELIAKDPENRLLARGPRFRLTAEFVRDQALAVSGLLNKQIGGRSVSPYHPPGLWEELMARSDGENWTAQTYVQDHGPDLYRRTMYTFWKRTSPHPALSTFDAPDRETCTVRRSRTNTPLQALVLMNDPTYVEASRKLAERMMNEGGQTAEERIDFAWRLTTARAAKPEEVAVLKKICETQLDKYRKDGAAAKKLLSIGESKRDEKLDEPELAAWTIVASTILNLDEVVTRN